MRGFGVSGVIEAIAFEAIKLGDLLLQEDEVPSRILLFFFAGFIGFVGVIDQLLLLVLFQGEELCDDCDCDIDIDDDADVPMPLPPTTTGSSALRRPFS